MPTSILVPEVFALAKKLQPSSILDVGPGFGKTGVLLREYLELWEHRRYKKTDWKIRIDCIEANRNYPSPIHEYIYDNIIIGDIIENTEIINDYELVVICDVLEHMSIEAGHAILDCCEKYIITTPQVFNEQGPVYNNEYERHVSRWGEKDFKYSKIIHSEIEKRTPIILGWNF